MVRTIDEVRNAHLEQDGIGVCRPLLNPFARPRVPAVEKAKTTRVDQLVSMWVCLGSVADREPLKAPLGSYQLSRFRFRPVHPLFDGGVQTAWETHSAQQTQDVSATGSQMHAECASGIRIGDMLPLKQEEGETECVIRVPVGEQQMFDVGR